MDTKKMAFTVTALLIACAGAACGGRSMSETKPSNPHADFSKKKLSHPYADVSERAPPQPELKRNPNPTAYEMIVTLKDAPGPFGSVKGFMQYETKLADPCLPDLGGMAGTRMRIKENVPFELQPLDSNTYRGVFYSNLFQDADYFGLGACHVGFIEARIILGADDRASVARFVAGVDGDEIESKGRKVAFFPKRQYASTDLEGISVPGMREGTPAYSRWSAEELFSMSLSVRKLP